MKKKKKLRDFDEDVYKQLIAQEVVFWQRLNEPVGREDFEFMVQRRGFQLRHIKKLINLLEKRGLAEHILAFETEQRVHE